MADNTYKYLQTLIRMGSFSRAAHELSISQPSLSQFIQRLESDAGVELVDRSTKPLQLTYAGQCYLKTEGEILRLREERDKLISDLADGKRGCIRVGASPYRAMFFLTSVLPEFRKRYSNVQVKLVEGRSHQLEVSAVQGDADFSIVLLPLDLPELEYQELYTERMLIALPRCSPLSDQVAATTNEFEPMDFRLLDKHPFIVIKKSAKYLKFYNELCERAGVKPEVVLETESQTAAIALANAGFGATLVAEPVIRGSFGLRGVRCYDISPTMYRRPVVVAYRREKYLSTAAKALISVMQEVAKADYIYR